MRHGRRLGLIAVLALSFAAPAIAEEPTPQQVVVMLQNDEGVGRDLLARVFVPRQGNPEAIADIAVAMIGRLEGDPVVTIGLATLIGEVAGVSLHAEPVLAVSVDPNYALPRNGLGFDLGPANGPLMRAFQAVDDQDPRVYGASLGTRFDPSADPLLADALAGLDRFATEVPNGDYELLLLTQADGSLGATLAVNGREHRLMAGVQGAARLTTDGSEGSGSGGLVSLPLAIADGRLELMFEAATLAAVLVIPIGAGPQVAHDAETAAFLAAMAPRVNVAEERIAAAIASLLARVATAAGADERVAALGLIDQPVPLEDPVSVSPE